MTDGFDDNRPPWRVVFGVALLVLVGGLVGGQVAYLVSTTRPDIWQARSEIEFRDPLLLGETVAVALESPTIWSPLAEREGIDQTEFLKRYAATVEGGTQIVSVLYQDEDPERAKRIVRGAVEGYLLRSVDQGLNQQMAALDDYLATLRALEADLVDVLEDTTDLRREEQIDRQNQLIAVRQQITNVLLRIDQRLAEAEIERDDAPRLVTDAFVGNEPIAPERAQIAVFGFAAGSLVGLLTGFLFAHRAAIRTSAPTRTAGTAGPVGSAPIARRRPSLFARGAKRSLDVVGSGLGLLVLSPLMIVIAVAIVAETGRPVLYRQTRLGRHERPFEMLKFRSMVTDNDPSEHIAYQTALLTATDTDELAQQGGVFKLADPRVTRIGRIIRRFSLDEIPQLINVFKGDMSLVGPRPVMPWEAELLSDAHRVRADVRPGCSGLWQVSGRNLLTTRQMLDIDARYVREWSLWRDLMILVRTPFAILRGDGAR